MLVVASPESLDDYLVSLRNVDLSFSIFSMLLPCNSDDVIAFCGKCIELIRGVQCENYVSNFSLLCLHCDEDLHAPKI